MKSRKVSRREAEGACNSELAGLLCGFGGLGEATMPRLHLPAKPTPGGSHGNGFLPLTYEYSFEGSTHTHITRNGPEVDELRAFLQVTIGDLKNGERVQLWFEHGHTPGLDCR